MRTISFSDKESIANLITSLQSDSEGYKQQFNDDPLSLIYWSLNDVVGTEVAINQLQSLLEQLELEENLLDFCHWKLMNVDFLSNEIVSKMRAHIWKEIIEQVRYMEV